MVCSEGLRFQRLWAASYRPSHFLHSQFSCDRMDAVDIMRILHIGCAYRPYPGGSTVRLESLVSIYARQAEVYLATHTGRAGDSDDVPFIQVLRDAGVNRPFFGFKLFRFIKRVAPHVVVLHNSRALLAWHLCYRWLFPGTLVVCEIHSLRERADVHRRVNRLLYRFCNRIVVLSRSAAGWLEVRHGIKDAMVIYNGLTQHSGIPNREIRIYDPAMVHYVYAGSFHEWQGVLVIAKAAKQLGAKFWQNHRLSLVGDGPALEEVRSILGPELLALETIDVPGWLPPKQTQELISNADFLLAPRVSNLATETVVPLKVVESVSFRKPLIAGDVGGLQELLGGAHPSAVFVTAGSVGALSDALSAPIGLSRYRELEGRLENLAASLPTWKQEGQKYLDLFRALAAQR